MNKQSTIWVVLIIVIFIIVVVVFSKNNINNGKNELKNNPQEKMEDVISTTNQTPIKEFSMTSFMEMVDGKPKPQFSLKDITVNKGDRVRIKIMVTSGDHDFKIDEYGIYANTQLNEEFTVDFIADKAGEFVYYCTRPGHRQNGQWGTLKVV
jgi:uncharacterized cupredoxin-like copper-binding protein